MDNFGKIKCLFTRYLYNSIDYFILFQITRLINNKNVLVVAPCGSGKSLIMKLGINILRKTMNISNSIGMCLEPVNNIMYEKTKSNSTLKSAFITMTGQGLKSDNVTLSQFYVEYKSGDIGCLLGHTESFLSPKDKDQIIKTALHACKSTQITMNAHNCQTHTQLLFNQDMTR